MNTNLKENLIDIPKETAYSTRMTTEQLQRLFETKQKIDALQSQMDKIYDELVVHLGLVKETTEELNLFDVVYNCKEEDIEEHLRAFKVL